jgi:LPPG:FO 2-phospho-L-lactate transferase
MTMTRQVTCLAGGVGAARFLQGLVKVVPEKQVTVIVNTGDDIELHGLHISPDLDIVMYTLANIVDEEKGWGIRGDTFNCLEMLESYERETWFRLGDKDLATHIYRTHLLKNGATLSEATAKISGALGLSVEVLPMTDHKLATKVMTNVGPMHFQEYLVRRQAQDDVRDVVFEGSERAEPAPGVVDSILNANTVIICPSNPIVSIGTILSLRQVRDALRRTNAKITAISPIVGGAPIKGPADKLMQGLGLEVSAYAVACLYQGFLDFFILDNVDMTESGRIEELGLKTVVTNTIMWHLKDKIELAKAALEPDSL